MKDTFMNTLFVIFILLHSFSLGFAFFSLWRLYEYIKRYRFDESKYTLLFRFVHLRGIASGYLVFSFVWVVLSYFIFTRL